MFFLTSIEYMAQVKLFLCRPWRYKWW